MNLHGYSPARRSIVRACTLLLVVVTVIDMGLGSIAYASTSLTVKVSNGGDYSATARSVTLTDTSFGNVTWTCSTVKSKPASRINGRLTSGTHTGNAPVMIGAFSGWAFNNCDGPGGPFAKFKLRSLPYNIAADSTTSGSGKTDLIISGINAFIEWAGCQFTLTGSAAGYYTNSNHMLTLTSKPPTAPLNKAQLTVKKVSGCAGLPSNGHHFTIETAYPLSIPVKISSS